MHSLRLCLSLCLLYLRVVSSHPADRYCFVQQPPVRHLVTQGTRRDDQGMTGSAHITTLPRHCITECEKLNVCKKHRDTREGAHRATATCLLTPSSSCVHALHSRLGWAGLDAGQSRKQPAPKEGRGCGKGRWVVFCQSSANGCQKEEALVPQCSFWQVIGQGGRPYVNVSMWVVDHQTNKCDLCLALCQ